MVGFLAASFFFAAEPALAYIGPGAGFAFLGSSLVFVVTIVSGVITLLAWPLRLVWRKCRGLGISKKARTRRVVVLGLDGLDPNLVEKFISEGKMPNLSALKGEGGYSRLGTTLPALSPVAWSTFQTGVNPGAHNIYDFLTRDKRTCLPVMSSTETVRGNAGFFRKLLKLPGRAEVRIYRKSKPFWKVLGDYGIFSTVLRVPISYPAEPFGGVILSAMCTPDLRGSQGTFSYFTTRSDESAVVTGGEVNQLQSGSSADGKGSSSLRGKIVGPPKPGGSVNEHLSVDFELIPRAGGATLKVCGSVVELRLNQFSDWVKLLFPISRRKGISGIARFCLREVGDQVSLYVSPVNVDPEKPVLPIAAPLLFASWLAKRQGSFGTLGLMEDTWGRNEKALDDQRFLDQTYATHAERERMFLESLDRTREGMCACVFDASDRIQHMFWRYLDDNHPSPREDDSFKGVIEDMYLRMDQLVGKVRKKVGPKDTLIVLSDHGFSSFRRCVNLNAWLKEQGYLVLNEGKSTGADYLVDVDWSKTRAFAIGLAGLYINKQGREWRGIVPEGEFESLKAEIAAKLEQLTDPSCGESAVSKVYDTDKAYRGLYKSEAPDLIVGYQPGYRVSWDSVTGSVESELFSDNLKAWSGDHHIDPVKVPGILFANRGLKVDNPRIIDLAPTILDLFAVPKPGYMEGRVIL